MSADPPGSDEPKEPLEKRWRGLRPQVVGAIVIALMLIALGYHYVSDLWLVWRHYVDPDINVVFALWLWLLFLAGGALVGTLGVGSRLKSVLTTRETLLLGISVLLLGSGLAFLAAYHPIHRWISALAGGCSWWSRQVVSAALYAAVVSFFGAFLVALAVRKEGPRHGLRTRYAASIVIVAIVVTAAVLSNNLVYARDPQEPCCHNCPDIELILSQREPWRVDVILVQDSGVTSFDFFLVNVTTNDTAWTGFPTALQPSSLGQGPSGEWLSFIDLAGEGRLSTGDYFRLGNARPDTVYEIALLAERNEAEVASIVIQT